MQLKKCYKCSKETYDYVFVYNEFSDDTLYICKACEYNKIVRNYHELDQSFFSKNSISELKVKIDKLTSENEGLKEENNRLRILLENGKNN